MRTNALLLACFSGTLVCYGQRDITGDALEGLRKVNAVLVAIPDVVRNAGLSEDQVRKDVELKLRLAGMEIGGKATAFVEVNVNVFCRKDAQICADTIGVRIGEFAAITRDGSLKSVFVYTWQDESLGSIGSARLADLRDSVKDQVDDFLNQWLAANPKPSPIPAPRK